MIQKINRIALVVLCPLWGGILLSSTGVWLLEGLERKTVTMSVLGMIALTFSAKAGYDAFYRFGQRRFFYTVFAVPTIIGICLTIGCVVLVLARGKLVS